MKNFSANVFLFYCLCVAMLFGAHESMASDLDVQYQKIKAGEKPELSEPLAGNMKAKKGEEDSVNNPKFDKDDFHGPFSKYPKPKQDGDSSASDLNKKLLENLSK